MGLAAACIAAAEPARLLHYHPVPVAEPDPSPAAIVELTEAPLLEPEPSPEALVQLGPAPAREPEPAAVGGTQVVVRRGEPEIQRLAAIVRDPTRLPTAEAPSESCGQGGAEPAGPGFTVSGHLLSARWVERTLHGVIANACNSKSYTDILPLDGGTVGIMHFASGSLRILYATMNAEYYFGRPASRVPDRPFAHAWWREGMARFLATREGRLAQQRAWRSYITPALASALAHGWRSERELAIAASIANSLGAGGFAVLAQQAGWTAERALLIYARMSAHKERRRQRLNSIFPPSPGAGPRA